MHDNGQGGYLEDWSRDGFSGDKALIRRTAYTPEFLSAEGPHVPRRLCAFNVPEASVGPYDLPLPIATAANGVRISVSRRTASMPYVLRNVECDEIHFVQQGELRFRTGYGTVHARHGDFVCIPRSIAYAVQLVSSDALTLVVESPLALALKPQTGPEPVDHLQGVVYPDLDEPRASHGETILLLKSVDEVTRFVLPHDPLNAIARAGGVNPVWKVRLEDIPPYDKGAPRPFVGTAANELLLFSLCASKRERRPPIHVNADYDEVIFYTAGPGAWGGVSEPGTFTWVPKGVTHNGPPENVPAGYSAWLLESRGTFRLTPAALAVAELMETGLYAVHSRRSPA